MPVLYFISTLSSGLNGYSMVFVEDICPIFVPRMGQKLKVFVGKVCGKSNR